MLENISWILTIIAITGTWLNTCKDVRGFYLWLASNLSFSVINFSSGMYAQGFLFGVYTILAIIGIQRWRAGERRDQE